MTEQTTQTTLIVPDSPKLLRETLCVAQTRIGNSPLDEGRKWEHIHCLERLIDECDRHRPLGPDGKHGDRHTATCGCGHPHAGHWGESASGRTECMEIGCPCGGPDVTRGPRSPAALCGHTVIADDDVLKCVLPRHSTDEHEAADGTTWTPDDEAKCDMAPVVLSTVNRVEEMVVDFRAIKRRLARLEATATQDEATPTAYQAEIVQTLTGAGLGDTIARQIAERLQGRFDIRQRPAAQDGDDDLGPLHAPDLTDPNMTACGESVQPVPVAHDPADGDVECAECLNKNNTRGES